MELLRPGDEFLSAYNPPTTDLDKLPQLGDSLHHQDDPPKVLCPFVLLFISQHSDGNLISELTVKVKLQTRGFLRKGCIKQTRSQTTFV